MLSRIPEAGVSRRLRSLVLRVTRTYAYQTNLDAGVLETMQELERRVHQLEFSLREQSDRAQRLEILCQDLAAAVETLRQRNEPGERGPGTPVPSRVT